MNDLITPMPVSKDGPLLTERGAFYFIAALAVIFIVCIPLPRALSFLPSLAGVGFFVAFWAQHKKLPRPDAGLSFFLCAILALSALSGLWSAHGGEGLSRTTKTAEIFLPCLGLFAAVRALPSVVLYLPRILLSMAGFFVVAGIFFYVEYHLNFPISRLVTGIPVGQDIKRNMLDGFIFNRAIVFMVLLSLPIVYGFFYWNMPKKMRVLGLSGVGIGLLLALSVTQSQTAEVLLLLAGLMMLYPSGKLLARRILMGFILFMMLTAPLYAAPIYNTLFTSTKYYDPVAESRGFLFQASIPHRLEVWKFVSEKIREKPLLGHGVEATRYMHSGYTMQFMNTTHVLHPHNAVLQIWVEFGLVGILLAMAFMIYIFKTIDMLPCAARRYHTMMIVVSLTFMSMGYGLWQGWQLGMILALVAFGAALTKLYPGKTA